MTKTGMRPMALRAVLASTSKIDRDQKVVEGQNGYVPYDKLIIATGFAPFIIPVSGKDLPGVIT